LPSSRRNQRHVIEAAEVAGFNAVRRVRRRAQERRYTQDLFGLRVRGVLLRRVPVSGLARAQRPLQRKEENAGENESSNAGQRQWKWVGRYVIYLGRSDAAASA
jgi:hypothetical protein